LQFLQKTFNISFDLTQKKANKLTKLWLYSSNKQ